MASKYEPIPEPGEDDDREPPELTTPRAMIVAAIDDAIEYVEGALEPQRRLLSQRYKADPLGNEEEGRSQFQITEVRDTVLAIMPSLLRVFFGAEQVINYAPTRADNVEQAEQATQFVSNVVLRKDNNGFVEFHAWFKDALVRSMGVVKWWWEEKTRITEHDFSGHGPERMVELLNDATIELLDLEAAPDGTYSGRFRRTAEAGRARFASLPLEEFFFSRDARSLEEASVVGHRCWKSKGELVGMGISEETIKTHGQSFSTLERSESAQERFPDSFSGDPETRPDKSTEEIEYVEAYIWLGADPREESEGEAFAEPQLWKICTIGADHHIVATEQVDERPFAVLVPDPEPHTMVGGGPGEYVEPLQRLKTNITRGMLDSLSLAIFPRMEVVEGAVEMADVLNTEVGAPIRVRKAGSVTPLAVPFLGKEAFPLLEYADKIKANTVGVSEATTGLDAQSLQSSTKTAVQSAVRASQQQIEMIARIFAETGVKQLFRGLLKLVTAHTQAPRVMRVRGQYVPVDPRAWDADMDVELDLVLGAGLAEEKIATLNEELARQEQILANFGLNNPIVGLTEYRRTLGKKLELQGWKQTTAFYKEITPEIEQQLQDMMANQPKEPSVEQQLVELEKAKAQIEAMKKENEMNLKARELEFKLAEAERSHQLALEKLVMEQEIATERLAQEMQLKVQELELKYSTTLDEAALKAQAQREAAQMQSDIQREKHQMDAELQREKIASDAEVKRDVGAMAAASKTEGAAGAEKPRKKRRTYTIQRDANDKMLGVVAEEDDDE